MARIIWTEPALKHAEQIRDYIAKDSPANAIHFIEGLREHVMRLETFPESGMLLRRTSQRVYRAIFYGQYIVAYYLKGDDCYIAAVVHGRRRNRWITE